MQECPVWTPHHLSIWTPQTANMFGLWTQQTTKNSYLQTTLLLICITVTLLLYRCLYVLHSFSLVASKEYDECVTWAHQIHWFGTCQEMNTINNWRYEFIDAALHQTQSWDTITVECAQRNRNLQTWLQIIRNLEPKPWDLRIMKVKSVEIWELLRPKTQKSEPKSQEPCNIVITVKQVYCQMMYYKMKSTSYTTIQINSYKEPVHKVHVKS